MLAGRALAEAGERERAVAELERAATAFEACGAVPRRDAAERELRKLGRVVHRRTRKGTSDSEALGELSARVGGRTPGGRPQDQPRDRRGAVRESQDR